jgi:hypothetical protein
MTYILPTPDSILSPAEEAIRTSYGNLSLHLNERSSRIWAATEANRYGYGGISAVHRATGMDHKTIRKGIAELQLEHKEVASRIRSCGGGRKSIVSEEPDIVSKLYELLESSTRGDPESPLLWTNKSTYNLTKSLVDLGYNISQTTTHKMLISKGYSMQANKKKLEGKTHLDRDAQFSHINESAKKFLSKNLPVLSVDTKKKENIGNYKNNGKEYSEKGKPVEVNTHDFPNKELGKAIGSNIIKEMKNDQFVESARKQLINSSTIISWKEISLNWLNIINKKKEKSWFYKICEQINIKKPDVFVETGTYFGNGVELVKDDFNKIHSIELNEKFYYKAKKRFENNKKINIHLGDSSEVLDKLINNFDCPVLFYLDAHYSGGETSFGRE